LNSHGWWLDKTSSIKRKEKSFLSNIKLNFVHYVKLKLVGHQLLKFEILTHQQRYVLVEHLGIEPS